MKKTKKLSTKPICKMGWLPDLPDARDFMYAAPLKIMKALPRKMDLSKGCPAVYTQGNLGSCTANSLGVAFEFGRKKQKKVTFMPSRLFLYYNERVIINTVFSDSGAFLRDGIKCLKKQGICKESEWTYDDDPSPGAKFTKKPPASCYKNALNYQITSYQRLTGNINILKGCIAEGYPFVFGFTVYDSFLSKIGSDGIMPMPNFSKEGVVGGHAVIAIGYDDVKEMVLVRNSWGKSWGKNGNFWMPYAYISNANLADDFWTIRTVE